MKFSIKDLFSTCDEIRRKLRIWSHLLKKSLMENFFFLCSDDDENDDYDNTLCDSCDTIQKVHIIITKFTQKTFSIITG